MDQNTYDPTAVSAQLAQQNKEDREMMLRHTALSMAVEWGGSTSAKHAVDVAEEFYKFLSAEK